MTLANLKSRKMYIFLLLLTIGTTASFQGWRTLMNNFAVEVGHLNGAEFGLIGSIREVPGFLSLLVIYVLLFINEHKLAALSTIVMGLGVSITGLMPSFYGIAFTTLLMSFGFHYYETLNQSLTLQYFDFKEAPVVMGRLKSLSAVTNIAVGLSILGLAGLLTFTQLFAVAGLAAIGTGIYAYFLDPTSKDIVPQHKKMIFKWKYWLFYTLTFLSGARRQIFVAFAVFLLVEKFKFTITEITILFVFNNILNYFINPLVAKWVNKFGERKVFTIEYLALIIIFATYAYTENRYVAASLYVFDNIFYNFAMAIRTFFQKIADPKDIAPSMAVGFTINHIAAVVIPVIAGLAWMQNYRYVFIGAAALSGVSLILTQFVDKQLAKHSQ